MRNLILLASVLLITSCAGNAPENKAVVNTAPNNAAPVNTAPANTEETAESVRARDEIVSSTKKLQTVKFWTARTVFDSMPGLSGEMQYAEPDRFYIKQGENEAIIIGNDSFTKIDGKWEVSPQDMSGLKDAQKNALNEEMVKKIKNVEVIGKEKLDGQETTVYFHRGAPNNAVETSTRLWIGVENGLVVKSVVETKAAGRTQKVTTVYDYEKPVKIEAPKIGKN